MQELTLEATVDHITQVMAFVDAQLDAAACATKTKRLIDVAIDEVLSNIVHYAYAPETGMVTVQVEIHREPRVVEIIFIDAGVPYNPLTQEDPVAGQTCKERKAGGFGIYIVKKSMDDIQYEYIDGCNVTKIIKSY